MVLTERIKWLRERNEVTRDYPRALVNELVKGMLPIRSWFAPVNRTCIARYPAAINGGLLAVTLHCQLLQVGRKTIHVLIVRENRYSLGSEEVVVPDCQQPHEHGKVVLKGSRSEVLVHLSKTIKHCLEVVWTDRHHG